MILDKSLLENLSNKAKSNSRLRMNFNLHKSPEDNVQRMFNALEPGTIIPIQRHLSKDETIILIKGAVRVYFYDDSKNVIADWFIAETSENIGVHIPRGTWHSLDCLKTGTIIFEVNDGPYHPLTEDDVM